MSVTTPSGSIVASANAERETTDIRGRKIKYRRLNALDRMRLFHAVGAEDSSNAPLVGMALMAASCTEIDGVPLPFPTRASEVEAAVGRLDDDGINAITASLVADYVVDEASKDLKPDAPEAPPGAA